MKFTNNIEIKNRKAKFEYELLDKYMAGIVLGGSEIKAIRLGKASIAEAFCEFKDGELWIINMTVQEYKNASYFGHQPKQARKLLLNKKELKKLEKDVHKTGNTIVPLKLFINSKGIAKLDISLARGKKLYDKRETIKDRDNKRKLEKIKKSFR